MIEFLIGFGILLWLILALVGGGMMIEAHDLGVKFKNYTWWEYLLTIPLFALIAIAVGGLSWAIGSLFTMGVN